MSAALNPVKKRNIEGVDTACASVEQFGSGSQSSNVVELQEGKSIFLMDPIPLPI